MSEEELKELFQLRKMQDEVIALRTEAPPIYGEYLKKEARRLMQNLVNSKVAVDACTIETPKLIDINLDEYKTEPDHSLVTLSQRIDNLTKCLKYLK